jgi:hypothetical protein
MTHLGFVVVKFLSVGDIDVNGYVNTIDSLEKLAMKSGYLLWVLDQDLLTYQILDANNKLSYDH